MITPTLLCVGNLTVDEAVAPDGRRDESVGGDALYAALAALLVGGAPRVLAPVGDDPPSALLAAIAVAGTDPDGLPRRTAPTIRNIVRYAIDGSRSWYLVHGEDHFEALSVQPADLGPSDLAVDGVLLSGMAVHAQLALAEHVRPRTGATVYFDPQEDAIEGNEIALLGAVSRCDVFLPSEVEALRLARTDDLAGAMRRFLDAGPSIVVVKRAEAGCLVATAAAPTPVVVPAEVVEPVDSTGAGDAFCGAFAVEHLRSGDPLAAAGAGAAAARIAVSGSGPAALLEAARAGERDLHRRTAGAR